MQYFFALWTMRDTNLAENRPGGGGGYGNSTA
jgi:hypothetical protein